MSVALRGAYPAVNLIGPALERLGKAPERSVEHRAHQHGEYAALELIGDEKLDLARPFARGVKVPAVLHPAKRAVEVLNQDLQVRTVERHAAGEGLADELVGNRHVGHHGLDPLRAGCAPADLHRLTERHEFRVALHVGDEIEHVARAMANAPGGAELRHQAALTVARKSRALRSLSMRVTRKCPPYRSMPATICGRCSTGKFQTQRSNFTSN